jgi:UDP-N-acetylglucosamine 4,6-dehydratase/5-epimerase
MKKVIVTGGTGSIGKSFIEIYKERYEIFNISRDEFLQSELKRDVPSVNNIIGSIEDQNFILRAFDSIKPDIVVHTAAIKHIGIAENEPIQTCNINVVGSLNIISACIRNNVDVCVSISTDKACSPTGCYGHTKSLMEKCFIEANNNSGTRFAVCRFANVAHSRGSVLPIWLKLKKEDKPLLVTDINMNRLMFSLKDSTEFIDKTISLCKTHGGGFVGVKSDMKNVNIYDIAKEISDKIEIIGKISDVEKLDEDLIGIGELPFTYIIDDGYVMIRNKKNEGNNRLDKPINCKTAQNMDKDEIRKLIYGL